MILEPKERKSVTISIVSPSICHQVIGPDVMILFFWAPKSLQMVIAAMKFKRCLLLRRKAMTNLDTILKSRDITLSTKVHLVKAMVFPVVKYGYMKKAEH